MGKRPAKEKEKRQEVAANHDSSLAFRLFSGDSEQTSEPKPVHEHHENHAHQGGAFSFSIENDYKEAIGEKLSFSYIARYSLWLFALVASVAGMFLFLAASIAAYLSLSQISSAISSQIDSANAVVLSGASSLEGFSVAANSTADGIKNVQGSLDSLSTGIGGAAQSLETVSSVPLIGDLSGLKSAASDLRQSAQGLKSASQSFGSAQEGAASAFASLKGTAASLRSVKTSLLASKKSIIDSIAMAQIALIVACIGAEALLGSSLALCLTYGPPKKKL